MAQAARQTTFYTVDRQAGSGASAADKTQGEVSAKAQFTVAAKGTSSKASSQTQPQAPVTPKAPGQTQLAVSPQTPAPAQTAAPVAPLAAKPAHPVTSKALAAPTVEKVAAVAPPAAPQTVNPPAAVSPQPAASKVATSATGLHYALQVGACTTNDCRDNYRKILERHVAPAAIHVVVQEGKNGQKVQRIRVEPLGKEEGQALKKKLEAADKLFAGSYLSVVP